MTAQLECKLCKTKRELTEEETTESVDIISKRNLKPDSILNIWNLYDGEKCPEGGMHEYDWNKEYYEKMLNDASKIRENSAQIVRNKNEIMDLENKIDHMKKDTETKIKANIALEKSNAELKDAILKVSGREWNRWL